MALFFLLPLDGTMPKKKRGDARREARAEGRPSPEEKEQVLHIRPVEIVARAFVFDFDVFASITR